MRKLLCFLEYGKPWKIAFEINWPLKLRHYEKVTKFVLTIQLFLLSNVKTSGRFFQIFVAFLEKLNFNNDNCFAQLGQTTVIIVSGLKSVSSM